MPILEVGTQIGGKHGYPIAMREGLHYVHVPKGSAVYIDEHNASVLTSPAAMVALLGSGEEEE